MMNLIFTLFLTCLCLAASVAAYTYGDIEEAQLFGVWTCTVLLMGILNKEKQ